MYPSNLINKKDDIRYMKIEKFKIVNLIKDFIVNIDTYLVNFPHKEIELKKEIRSTSYELLESVYLANETKDTNRKNEYQDQAIARIKLLDFFLNLCYDKKIIDKKKYLKFGENLEQIIMYVYAWRKSSLVEEQKTKKT